MTLGEMRKQMIHRVVPEELIPQNIVGFLIDEEDEPPTLDTFTFLTRLRDLGVGSADFIYLLDGCGAPREAVERIQANPAMSLQGLIVTLESAGMTAEDYSRILYTARQIWERTLTLRLEKSELISQGDFPDESASEEDFAKFDEPSFTDVFEKVSNEITQTNYENLNTPNSMPNSADAYNFKISDIPQSKVTESAEPVVRETAREPIINASQSAAETGYFGTSEEFAAALNEQSGGIPETSVMFDENTGGIPETSVSFDEQTGEIPEISVTSQSEFKTDFFTANKESRTFNERSEGIQEPPAAIPETPLIPEFSEEPQSFAENAFDDKEREPVYSIFEDEIPTNDSDTADNTVLPETAEELPAAKEEIPQVSEDKTNDIPVSEIPDELFVNEDNIPGNISPDTESAAPVITDSQSVFESELPQEYTDETTDISKHEFPTAPFVLKDDKTRDISFDTEGPISTEPEIRSDFENEDMQSNASADLPFPPDNNMPRNISDSMDYSFDTEDAVMSKTDFPNPLETLENEETRRSEKNTDYSLPVTVRGGTAPVKVESPNMADNFDIDTPNENAENADGYRIRNIADTNTIIQIDRKLLEERLSQLTHGNVNLETGEYDTDDDNIGKSRRHRGAIIAAGIGAALLIGISTATGIYAEKPQESEYGFAADSDEIFASIYTAYNERTPGGDIARETEPYGSEIFGDMLVESDGLGVFVDGSNIYSVTSESVKVGAFSAGAFTVLGEWTPPENTSFIDAFEDNNAPVIVFGGKNECGFMKISQGKVVYTMHQDGKYTDSAKKDGELILCSVYTPSFYRTFSAADTEVFLPKIGKDNPETISPQDIIVSGTMGYSYGVNVHYSLETGAPVSAKAAIGDPVAVSADGRFAMGGEKGMLIDISGELKTAEAGKITAAAFWENGCAAYENGIVVIRDNNFNIKSQISAFPEPPTSIAFSGSVLLLIKDGQVIYAADCSDLTHHKVMSPRSVYGLVHDNDALTYETNDDGLIITRYTLENGSAVPQGSYTKKLTPSEKETLDPAPSNSVILGSGYSGAAYKYFDGVSIISEYAVFGSRQQSASLYDNKAGFICAFENNGQIYAVSSEGAAAVRADS